MSEIYVAGVEDSQTVNIFQKRWAQWREQGHAPKKLPKGPPKGIAKKINFTKVNGQKPGKAQAIQTSP